MALREAFAHAAAGTIGGVLSFALLYPLDNIRTRLQVQVNAKKPVPAAPMPTPRVVRCPSVKALSPRAEALAAATEVQALVSSIARCDTDYSSAWDCAKKVARSEGWQALYNGLTAGLVGVGVSTAIYFWWYFWLKRAALRVTGKPDLTPWANILIATVAGTINITMTSPIWVINTRMALQNNNSKAAGADAAATLKAKAEKAAALLAKVQQHGAANAAAQAAQDKVAEVAGEDAAAVVAAGVHAAAVSDGSVCGAASAAADAVGSAACAKYSGVWDACRKIVQEEGLTALYRGYLPSLILVSNPATQFVVYEQLVRLVLRKRGTAKPSALESFVIGAIAKAAATVVTYPYQVVKSRQQADTSPAHAAPSMLDVMRQMYREEGLAGFVGGMGTKLSQTVSNAALMFLIYEEILAVILRVMNGAKPAAAK